VHLPCGHDATGYGSSPDGPATCFLPSRFRYRSRDTTDGARRLAIFDSCPRAALRIRPPGNVIRRAPSSRALRAARTPGRGVPLVLDGPAPQKNAPPKFA
jgi:hypothetical protein